MFANETRKLAKLAGYVDGALERAVKLAFITGYPHQMLVEQQKLLNIHSMVMREVIF